MYTFRTCLMTMPVSLAMAVGLHRGRPRPRASRRPGFSASPTATPPARPLPVGDQPVDLVPAEFTANITNPYGRWSPTLGGPTETLTSRAPRRALLRW